MGNNTCCDNKPHIKDSTHKFNSDIFNIDKETNKKNDIKTSSYIDPIINKKLLLQCEDQRDQSIVMNNESLAVILKLKHDLLKFKLSNLGQANVADLVQNASEVNNNTSNLSEKKTGSFQENLTRKDISNKSNNTFIKLDQTQSSPNIKAKINTSFHLNLSNITQHTTVSNNKIDGKIKFADCQKRTFENIIQGDNDDYNEFENDELEPYLIDYDPQFSLLLEILNDTFPSLKEETIDMISKSMYSMELIKDFVLFTDKIQFFIVIIEGNIGYFKDNNLEKIYGKGDTFGDFGLKTEKEIDTFYMKSKIIKEDWKIKAISDAKIYVIDSKYLHNIIQKVNNKLFNNLEIIDGIPLIGNTNFESKKILAEKLSIKKYESKQLIIERNQLFDTILAIIEGKILVVDENEVIVNTLYKNNFVNYQIIAKDKANSSYSYYATQSTTLGVITELSLVEAYSQKYKDRIIFEVFCNCVEENNFLFKLLLDKKGSHIGNNRSPLKLTKTHSVVIKGNNDIINNNTNLIRQNSNNSQNLKLNTAFNPCSPNVARKSLVDLHKPLQKSYTRNDEKSVSHSQFKSSHLLLNKEANPKLRDNLDTSLIVSVISNTNQSNLSCSFTYNKSGVYDIIKHNNSYFTEMISEKKELFDMFTIRLITKEDFSIQNIKENKILYIILYGEIIEVSKILFNLSTRMKRT